MSMTRAEALRIFAGEALGYQRMRASAQQEVIAYLAASDVPAPTRRRWYREWCRATFTMCRPEDLDRVAPRMAREQQLGLLDDASGRDEAQCESDEHTTPRKGRRSSSAKSHDAETATGATTPAKAFTSGE